MKIKYLIVIAGIISIMGCSTTNRTYSRYYYLVNSTDGSVCATENNIEPVKVGRAYSEGYLAQVAFGDSSIDAAMKNGNIKKIAFIDYSYLYCSLFIIVAWFPVYEKYTTIVYGE